MSPDNVSKFIRSNLSVLREDIARAKSFLATLPSGRAEYQATAWLKGQGIEEPNRVQTQNESQLLQLARAYSLRKAFYQSAVRVGRIR